MSPHSLPSVLPWFYSGFWGYQLQNAIGSQYEIRKYAAFPFLLPFFHAKYCLIGSGKRKAFAPLILQPGHTSQNFIHTALQTSTSSRLRLLIRHYYVSEAHFNSGCCRLAFLRVEAFLATSSPCTMGAGSSLTLRLMELFWKTCT